MTKPEAPIGADPDPSPFDIRGFGFLSSFVIRHSDFGFRSSPLPVIAKLRVSLASPPRSLRSSRFKPFPNAKKRRGRFLRPAFE